MLRIADVMSEVPLTVLEDMALPELAWLMSVRSAHSVLVVDRQGGLTGVVTLSDLVTEMANSGLKGDPCFRPWWDYLETDLAGDDENSQSVARDVMSPGLVTVGEETDLREAAETMVAHDLQRMIVVRDARPVGLVSALDLVRGLLTERLPVPSIQAR